MECRMAVLFLKLKQMPHLFCFLNLKLLAYEATRLTCQVIIEGVYVYAQQKHVQSVANWYWAANSVNLEKRRIVKSK